MSEESGWTIDTLYAHLSGMADERDHRYEQRFLASEKAVQAALTSAKEAVLKAESATEKRFESVNEFRAQLSDQAHSFMPRAEYDARHESLVAATELLASRLDRIEGHSEGLSSGGQYTVMGLAALASIAAVVSVIFALVH